ncbi:hypothetical protein [Alkalibacillus silvisoli]|uniref:DUF1499 domain-containing protein n=1 Tax=Alkalibacillus silvisoli TaxID=392823 RepID=A0ABP3JI67_9BACI
MNVVEILVPVLAVLFSILASNNFKWWTAAFFTIITYIGFQLIFDLYLYGVTSVVDIIASNWVFIGVLTVFSTSIRLALTAVTGRLMKVAFVFVMVLILAGFTVITQVQTTTLGEVLKDEEIEEVQEITINPSGLVPWDPNEVVVDDEETINRILSGFNDLTLRSGVSIPPEDRIFLNIDQRVGQKRIEVDEHFIRVGVMSGSYRVDEQNELYQFIQELIESEQ